MTSTEPSGPRPIARAYTRARNFGRLIVRPFGPASVEFPFKPQVRQVTVVFVGIIASALIGVFGSVLGIGWFLGGAGLLVTATLTVVLGSGSVPHKGAYDYIEGWIRSAWLALPFTRSVSHSRPRPDRGKTHLAADAMFGPAPHPSPTGGWPFVE
ncbi:hypothetical protein [Mycobacteroides abscessus]|uniref:Transmembrane protein n=1 Tax=Mycobacteroides abscessus subsp. bolletii CRM-0020 TaxID=1306401 RepID=A0A829HN49_9MYCO|nr:hypothetical protein [Mycobacteroides abscessus]EPQ20961.1 hypothetical protein J108_23395 [Mycobacteroides abscessus subsp. bolletii CRM-0020]MBN7488238.1 hypothetical protein [Mycobacteroides abscessus subsp. abscessus]SIA41969.1 Uncharacterised protein [Mycobacteroides abscessus subsp. abscessus]SIA57071.1 Uncharacterised protein [Mycobacteroides abscessus subsp. abscessus]SKQ74937.1 Uncharacterised protein [Mycobacteroides abscessus subsp. massiliense]